MARHWFTTQPDKYFMRPNRKGHRNEVLFTILGLAYIHFYHLKPAREDLNKRNISGDYLWKKVRSADGDFIINPTEKVGPKFLSK